MAMKEGSINIKHDWVIKLSMQTVGSHLFISNTFVTYDDFSQLMRIEKLTKCYELVQKMRLRLGYGTPKLSDGKESHRANNSLTCVISSSRKFVHII